MGKPPGTELAVDEPKDNLKDIINGIQCTLFSCIPNLHCSLVIPKCIFIPEGEGVVEEEWEGRCLPCCLEAILDAAAQ